MPAAVIEERDRQYSIYEVPLSLVNSGLDDILVRRLGLRTEPLEIGEWRDLVARIIHPEREVTIAVVGKYIKHRDSYKSVYESLDHAGIIQAINPAMDLIWTNKATAQEAMDQAVKTAAPLMQGRY